jgi:pimeloyl-ACP methyl ester carboxylesterase
MSRSPSRSRLRAAGAAALAAVAVFAVTACDPAPSADSFYAPPAAVSGPSGNIIRSRVSKFAGDPVGKAPVPGVTSTQVVYNSTDVHGNPIAVSGTVLVPTAPYIGLSSRPLITMGVGTRGLGQDCAPSYSLTQGTDYEASTITAALNKGYAVAVTDYQGMGLPGPHTYMVGKALGHAVLDMARAAERLPGSGLSSSTPVGIWGYSEGGAAAGWAAELAPTYAPELNLRGVAMGGVPADLLQVASMLDGSAFLSFELMTAVGYNKAYPELNLSSYLNTAGKDLLTTAIDTCLVSADGFGQIAGTAYKHVSDFTTSNPLASPLWQARINENKLGNGKPTVPVYQYHAGADDIVQFAQADTLHKTYCAKGVNETWQVFPNAEHALGMVQGQGPALDFLSARFNYLPVFGNC